jgi:hypothetical protein
MDRALQVMIDAEERRRARRRAAEQGLTLSDYIARLVRADLEAWRADPDQPAVIPMVADEPAHHDNMNIGEAVAARMNKPPEPAS